MRCPPQPSFSIGKHPPRLGDLCFLLPVLVIDGPPFCDQQFVFTLRRVVLFSQLFKRGVVRDRGLLFPATHLIDDSLSLCPRKVSVLRQYSAPCDASALCSGSALPHAEHWRLYVARNRYAFPADLCRWSSILCPPDRADLDCTLTFRALGLHRRDRCGRCPWFIRLANLPRCWHTNHPWQQDRTFRPVQMVPRRALAVGGFDLCRDLFCTGSFSTIELVLLGFRPSRPWTKSVIGADCRFRDRVPSCPPHSTNHERVSFVEVQTFLKFIVVHVLAHP